MYQKSQIERYLNLQHNFVMICWKSNATTWINYIFFDIFKLVTESIILATAGKLI